MREWIALRSSIDNEYTKMHMFPYNMDKQIGICIPLYNNVCTIETNIYLEQKITLCFEI